MGPIDQSAYSYQAIGSRLAAIRNYVGKSQAEFAPSVGMSAGRWANYEIGTSRIPVDEAIKIVQLVGVSLDYIYYGNRALVPTELADALDLWQRFHRPTKRSKGPRPVRAAPTQGR